MSLDLSPAASLHHSLLSLSGFLLPITQRGGLKWDGQHWGGRGEAGDGSQSAPLSQPFSQPTLSPAEQREEVEEARDAPSRPREVHLPEGAGGGREEEGGATTMNSDPMMFSQRFLSSRDRRQVTHARGHEHAHKHAPVHVHIYEK